VFLTVFGAVMLALAQLSNIAQRAARANAVKRAAKAQESAP
jgi:multicomponent K+:H+ antiporter subunit A